MVDRLRSGVEVILITGGIEFGVESKSGCGAGEIHFDGVGDPSFWVTDEFVKRGGAGSSTGERSVVKTISIGG